MKKLISIIVLLFILRIGFAQNKNEIVGTWKFQSVTTTDQSCKSVDYFPINTFQFKENGKAEFKSAEGIAEASYRVDQNTIKLYDLIENGQKQEGSTQFRLKSVNNTTMILNVKYECGSIDIVFKKE
ncbi:DUF2147 domain-containing protein [Salibacter halophilus]|uniref:Lipocalin family protein n=1 Tax=Salibacter halophilus TaxID=1803916 RepID=A0A6N6M7X1_9FLAO|nr:hypothetical protein [Salibacter halophilus]KAB1065994.1 hypothetical protein F3059_00545 [Salibacter halophilus]